METDSAADQGSAIFFPLDQVERAKQARVEHLLPRAVYAQLADLIRESLPDVQAETETQADYFSRARRHNAILLDGDRGVGKSSVLVNLPLYLEKRAAELHRDVHVLKPVDPTQLEEHDDLFLNVIVAAVMSDRDLQAAIRADGAKREIVHKSLHALSIALEARHTGKTSAGIDQLRAFMGSHMLTEAIHDFFQAAVRALGKRLLVLSLDDVDTTLDRAFENLEVVRRYLSTPLVLPVICGHLPLYHEVIQREYHRRIAGESCNGMPVKLGLTNELAIEYERKLLPVRSRLLLPAIEDYLADPAIRFAAGGGEPRAYSIGLIHLRDWIEAILMGPVNGLENSMLRVPIPSLRAMAQLAARMRPEIDRLDKLLGPLPRLDGLDIRTLLQMPGTSRATIRAFKEEQDRGRVGEKTATESAYSTFVRHRGHVEKFPQNDELVLEARAWRRPLYDLLRQEPTAGKACMVLDASMHWEPKKIEPIGALANEGVLNTPLFMPTRQQDPRYLEFAPRDAKLNGWKGALLGRLPEDALQRLPEACIAPFPIPESGRHMPMGWRTRFAASDLVGPGNHDTSPERLAKLNVINELMLHRGYYSAEQRAPLLLTGRLLELLVTGLVRDVTESDVYRLQSAPPFHSAAAIAPTKTLIGERTEVGDEESGDDMAGESPESGIALLVQDINDWRELLGLSDFEPSPWLIYNALNKTLGQAWIFNGPSKDGLAVQPAQFVAQTARMTFDCFTAAVGSFEKGPLFGLAAVVSTTNVSRRENFRKSPLFLQNIAPFWGGHRNGFGLATRSITHALGRHPIREILTGLGQSTTARSSVAAEKSHTTDKLREEAAKKWLRRRLGGGGQSAFLGAKMVANLISRKALSSTDLARVQQELENRFPDAQRAHRLLAEGRKLAAARYT